MSTIPKLALIPSGVKASKVYSVLPTDGTGDFTFARAGAATRLNSAGLIEEVLSNVPRLNYPIIDGVVSGCPSLLLEPQRTNVVLYSQELNNAYWVVNPGTFVNANDIISPDGTLNADKLSETTFNGLHQMYSGVISTTISVLNTYSIFAKKGERNWIKIQNGSTSQANFNLNDGTIGTVSGATAKIEDYGNGWYRCQISFIAPNSSDRLYVRIMTSDNVTSYIGDGISGVYLWGAMAEIGSYVSSYVPTNGSTVTRVAETANGAGDANTFNDSEGVLMFEGSSIANDNTYKVVSLRGASNNILNLGYSLNSNNIYFYKEVNGVSHSPVLPQSAVNVLNFNKVAVSYSESINYLWINGFKTVSSTGVGAFTNLSSLNLDSAGSTPFYGNTKQLQYFDSALNDTELETLTSWVSFSDMANSQQYTIE